MLIIEPIKKIAYTILPSNSFSQFLKLPITFIAIHPEAMRRRFLAISNDVFPEFKRNIVEKKKKETSTHPKRFLINFISGFW